MFFWASGPRQLTLKSFSVHSIAVKNYVELIPTASAFLTSEFSRDNQPENETGRVAGREALIGRIEPRLEPDGYEVQLWILATGQRRTG